jgi:hypothetical protein
VLSSAQKHRWDARGPPVLVHLLDGHRSTRGSRLCTKPTLLLPTCATGIPVPLMEQQYRWQLWDPGGATRERQGRTSSTQGLASHSLRGHTWDAGVTEKIRVEAWCCLLLYSQPFPTASCFLQMSHVCAVTQQGYLSAGGEGLNGAQKSLSDESIALPHLKWIL